MGRFHAPLGEIRSALRNRGVLVRPGASEQSINFLVSVSPDLPDSFFDIFRQFDGFEDGQVDGPSVLAIWAIDRIAKVAKESVYRDSQSIAIGDFMMGSEYICCDQKDMDRPVFLDESGEQIAKSYFDFWERLCLGKLDFM